MNEVQKIMQHARAIAEANVIVGARELVELNNTCILPNGVVREIARVVCQIYPDSTINLAQAIMRDAIINWAANQEIK